MRLAVCCGEGKELYNVLMPPEANVTITDFRTELTGLTATNFTGETTPFAEAQAKLRTLIDSSDLVVGHGISHDFAVMGLHSKDGHVADTADLYAKFFQGRKIRPSLKKLASVELRLLVQEGVHDPLEDARLAMQVFRKRQDSEFLAIPGVLARMNLDQDPVSASSQYEKN